MGDRLRSLWDFDNLDGSEQRLQAQFEEEQSDAARAEVLTQLARVEGLRGDFDASERLLQQAQEIAGSSDVALARIDLERGRKLRSSGDVGGSLPLFESAFAFAAKAGEEFIAADAAHMAALAAGDQAGFDAWTQRGIDLAESSDDPSVAYWLGPLYNNLGWELSEAGNYDEALEAFQRALDARKRDPDKPYEIDVARYAIGKTLRALGRADEAVPLLERCVANYGQDSYFHEAREQAELALALLTDGEDERTARLRELAG